MTDQYLQATTDAGLITELVLGGQENQSSFYQTYLPDGGFCCATASGGQCYDPLGNPIYSPCPSLYTCDGSPPPGDPHGLCTHPKEEWFALPATQALLARYKKWLIINVVGEDAPDDDLAWYRLAVSQINFYRDAGYSEPLSFLPGTYGRKLPTLLDAGAAVVAADPLHNVLLDWEAYWGTLNCEYDGGACVPHPGYPCCNERCGPYDGYYQQAYWPNAGIKEGLMMAADSGLPTMGAFTFIADINSMTFYDGGQGQLYPGYLQTANDSNTSWTWWILYGASSSIIDNNHDVWGDYCRGTYGPFGSVCNAIIGTLVPTCENLPSFGRVVMQMWDAGTNRACGR